ncbi:MAG: helix-turn-helix domain-containing protein [Winogradskyella sp.]|uniref:helix-turn-helix transcriptional regulator n=1 Tax=Winogradskyella sp. TaxID=1883156 RepID=UPI000F3FE746|nr:helix-turn-helix domain-containing protein [Winogradskyella sp.]RNC88248.1 MAG: helix-turn-helix domain-containing protein [Winogradskyella sp.]
MKKDIPHIAFQPGEKENFGLDIIPIGKIKSLKDNFNHNPEQPHQIKFYNLIFFTEGEGRHFIDFNWFPVQENTLIYLTKDQVNAFDFSSDLKGYCMLFTEDYFVNSFLHLPEDFVFRLFNPQLFSPILQIPKQSDFNSYFKLLLNEFNQTNGFNQKTILESLFVILVSKAEYYKQHQTFHIKDSSQIQLFQKFTKLLEDNFHKTRSANFYANQLGITYKHLNTISKALVNKTAKHVIDDYVILQAKRNLINSSIKSTQLAYKLGFEDATNFTKYFKKNTGLTPKSFKNTLK